MFIRGNGGGGDSDKYDCVQFTQRTGGQQIVYQTKGRAKAIWQIYGRTDQAEWGIWTNVNPTTGEISDNSVFISYKNALAWTESTEVHFTITDTTITSPAVSSNVRYVALAYTYE